MYSNSIIVKYKTNTGEQEKGIARSRSVANDQTVVRADIPDIKPWDEAHLLVNNDGNIAFAEPEVLSTRNFYSYTPPPVIATRGAAPVSASTYLDFWPHPKSPRVWHLEDEFSQLQSARKQIKELTVKKKIRIAHLDTGYDAGHKSFPQTLINKQLQRNFVEGEENNWQNAEDPFTDKLLTMPGHGTGTLSILAGTKAPVTSCTFDDYIGLYDSVEIVPIRIASSVVLLKSTAFVRAMDYIVNQLHDNEDTRIHVITMSMGGLPSAAWADLINQAYEKGIFIVTAAGNNFAKLPTRTLVYPARFNRVVAACGVTFDYSPYSKLPGQGGFNIMEGNYGPEALMDTAMAAFTPNVPWAEYTNDDEVGIRGNGTSSATPQIAAAAALYYSKYFKQLEALPEPWMKVEAIRHAMFTSAQKSVKGRKEGYKIYFGNGTLRAADMLKREVLPANSYTKTPADSVSFPFFRLLFNTRSLDSQENVQQQMLDTELMQLVLTDPEIQKILKDEEKGIEQLTSAELKKFIAAVTRNGNTSNVLKERINGV